jgi:hypothetical protein
MAWDPTQPPNNGSLLSAPIRANWAALAPLMQGPGGTPFPILAPDGTAAAPSYSFASAPGLGWYRHASGSSMVLGGSGGALLRIYENAGGMVFHSASALAWTGGGATDGADLILARDAAGFLAQRNGANPQTFRIYETYIDVNNWSALQLTGGSSMSILTGSAGTGVARALKLGTQGAAPLTIMLNNTNVWYFETDGSFNPLTAAADIGNDGMRVRNLFLSSGVNLKALAAAPATPPAGSVVVYAKTDKKAYQKDDAGVETPLGGGGGGAAAIRLPLEQATLPDGTAGNVPPEFVREKSTGVLSGAPSPTRTYARFAGDAAAVAESLMWSFMLPSNYGAGGTIRLKWKAAVATTGAVIWKAGAAPVTDGSTDDDSVAFTAVTTAAASNAPATQGQSVEVTLALTTTNFAALRWVTVFVSRDPVSAADTMTGSGTAGDAILMGVQFEYTPA